MATMSEANGDGRGDRAGLSAPLILCVLLWLLAPSAVGAEIFKCKGADGKAIYTSDPTVCPGTRPHELKTEMQTVVPSSRAGRSSAGRTASEKEAVGEAEKGAAGGIPDGLMEMWRRKRPEARAKLAELKSHAEYLHAVAGGCNRGATWYAKDEAGLKHYVSCDELKSRGLKVDREIAKLEAYLAGGLEDECRRAGCLPGWIR
jgi:hypothetical protein